MSRQPVPSSDRSLGDSARALARRAIAGVALFIGAIILLKFAIGIAIGFLSSIVTLLVVIGVIVGVVWALKNV